MFRCIIAFAYIDYLNIVYTMHYIHINSLCLNQHLMHLLYILCYILLYAFRHTSAPSAGDLIFNSSILAHQLAVNTCQNALVKYGLLTDAVFFKILQRSLMMSNSYNPQSCNTSLSCGISKVTNTLILMWHVC